MTTLETTIVYGVEEKILSEAGLGNHDTLKQITTDQIRARAQTISSTVEETCKNSWLGWLSYKSGIGNTARQYRLSADLVLVAKDIDSRKGHEGADIIDNIFKGATTFFATALLCHKSRPTTGFESYYQNRY